MYRPNYSFSMPKPYLSQDLPKKFPEDIECIIKSKDPEAGSLYISNVEAAENPMTLKKFKIGAVLSCAKGYELKHPPHVVPHYKYIPTVDHEECDISIHFDEAVDFITSKLQKTNVLAHCIAGVSRSVSMVLAYFIREHGMQYDQAYHLVKSKRKIIHPNDGFISQLKKYSERVKSSTPKKQVAPQKNNSEPKYALSRSNLLDTSTIQRKTNNFVLDRSQTDFQASQLTPKKNVYNDSMSNNFKSTQLTKYDNFNEKPLDQHKSSQLTPKSQYGVSRQYKNDIQRTSVSFFTPNKAPVHNYRENIRNYEQISKSVNNIQKNNSYERKINAEVTPNKAEKQENFTKEGTRPNRAGPYESMNSQLNDKIEQIRKKYELERQKLYDRYQTFQPKQSHQEERPYTTTNGDRSFVGEARRGSVENTRANRAYEDRVIINNNSNGFEQTYSSTRHIMDRSDTKITPAQQKASYYEDIYTRKYEPYSSAVKRDESYYSRKYESKVNYDSKYDKYEDVIQTKGRQGYSPIYNYGGNYRRY